MKCYFKRDIYKNNDNGFNIIVYESNDASVPSEARNGLPGDTFSFTAKGFNLPVTPAVEIELDGKWIESKYGLQLEVSSFVENKPTSKSGIIGYLSSGLITGIGDKIAEAIYDRFKDKTLDVLENTPEKLLEIKGITAQKLDLIKVSYNESRAIKDIVTFLSPYGISANKAVKIKKAFGANAYSIIKSNPFKLCSISGFGFATVDKIARKVNCSLTEPLRLTSGVIYVLEEAAAAHGHLFMPVSELCNDAYNLLNDGFPEEIVNVRMVQSAINSLVKAKELTYEKNYKVIYSRRKYVEEMNTAIAVAGFLTTPVQSMDISKYLKQAQKELNILLSPDQNKAVKMSFEHNISIITGGPGTGKTTILKVVLYIYGIVFKEKKILLAAPTGRASRRMAESTGYSEAFTLHSALGLIADDENAYMNDGADLDADFVIVDEMSMVDMFLAHELFSRIKKGTKILLVGDADQLPSIGAGNVFRELLSCDIIPKTRLSMIYRQANESLIPINAHTINQGSTDLQYGPNFEFIECENDDEANNIITERYVAELAHLNIQDIQVLTPRKDKVKASSKEINEVVRELVNPIRPPNRQINVGKRSFRVNDRVMQIKNASPISNGDIGIITQIGKDKENKDVITIDFDGRVVNYHPENMDVIVHSYAITIHKSQGSEYDVVLIPLLTSSYIMIKRNLIYTAITRAKRKVVLVGQKKALLIFQPHGCEHEICFITKKKRDLSLVNVLADIKYQTGEGLLESEVIEKGIKLWGPLVKDIADRKLKEKLRQYKRWPESWQYEHGRKLHGCIPFRVYTARGSGKDLKQDLADIAEGYEVIHASDLQKAAAAQKRERKTKRQQAKVRKQEKKNIQNWLAWLRDDNVSDALKRYAETELSKRNINYSAVVENQRAEQMSLII